MPLATYSALRVALLAACFALGYWAGLRTWLLLVVATFAAWGLSYVLLQRPRDAAALYLAERAQQRAAGGRRPAEAEDLDARYEDAVDDAARRRATGRGVPDHRDDGPDPGGTSPGSDPHDEVDSR